MVIVYGFKTTLKQGKNLGYSICPNCNHNTEKVLAKEFFKFHIFYIPLLFFTKRRGIVCPACGMYKELSAAEYNQMNN